MEMEGNNRGQTWTIYPFCRPLFAAQQHALFRVITASARAPRWISCLTGWLGREIEFGRLGRGGSNLRGGGPSGFGHSLACCMLCGLIRQQSLLRCIPCIPHRPRRNLHSIAAFCLYLQRSSYSPVDIGLCREGRSPNNENQKFLV